MYVPSASSYLSALVSSSPTRSACSSSYPPISDIDMNKDSRDISAILLITCLQCSTARLGASRNLSSSNANSFPLLLSMILFSLSSSLIVAYASFSSTFLKGSRYAVVIMLNAVCITAIPNSCAVRFKNEKCITAFKA